MVRRQCVSIITKSTILFFVPYTCWEGGRGRDAGEGGMSCRVQAFSAFFLIF